MKKEIVHGSAMLALILGVAGVLGAGMLIKNEEGTPYTQDVYNMAHYFVVGRGEEAMLKAKEVKEKMQKHESEIQKELDKS